MTTEELDRLAELEKAATPGPWTAQKNNTPMVKSDFGALVLHSDAAEQLAAKDAEIERLTRELERRIALAVAEVRAWRTCRKIGAEYVKAENDVSLTDIEAQYGNAIAARAAATAATDADPVLAKMIGGGE